MRYVLRDTDEVCHFWANQSQESGSNKTRSVYFERERIYSYGSHFCMARILPSGVVVVSTRTYSVTTTGHMHHMQNAIRGRTVVYCHNPAANVHANMDHARHQVISLIESAKRPRLQHRTRVQRRAQALETAESANEYLAALPPDEQLSAQPIDTTNLQSAAADLAQWQRAADESRKALHAARLADLQADLQAWRAHEIITRTGLSNLPCALRLSQDRTRIQTSWGAEIDTKHAPLLWGLIERTRTGRREPTNPALPLGPYVLNNIRADGSIVVGCHDIPYSELANIAQQLGYITEQTA